MNGADAVDEPRADAERALERSRARTETGASSSRRSSLALAVDGSEPTRGSSWRSSRSATRAWTRLLRRCTPAHSSRARSRGPQRDRSRSEASNSPRRVACARASLGFTTPGRDRPRRRATGTTRSLRRAARSTSASRTATTAPSSGRGRRSCRSPRRETTRTCSTPATSGSRSAFASPRTRLLTRASWARLASSRSRTAACASRSSRTSTNASTSFELPLLGPELARRARDRSSTAGSRRANSKAPAARSIGWSCSSTGAGELRRSSGRRPTCCARNGLPRAATSAEEDARALAGFRESRAPWWIAKTLHVLGEDARRRARTRARNSCVGMTEMREQLEREAREAAAALPLLADELVERALAGAARPVARARRRRARGESRRTSPPPRAASTRARSTGCASTASGSTRSPSSCATLSQLPPLEREIASWTLDNGLHVEERRIPIGVVGANFEARPNVAVDVAGQLLKSRNAALLRTGGAALRTVTALVDDVLRPALERAGPAAGRGRARPLARPRGRPCARLAAEARPARDPARQRPDDGRARAARGGARRAHARARRGRRRPLRARGRRRGEGARAGRGEPRPARRLQPAQPAARRPRRCRARAGCSSALAQRRRRGARAAARSGTSGRTTPSTSRPSPSHVVDVARRGRRRSRTRRPPASPPGSSPRTRPRPRASSTAYRGTAAFWHAPTRFTDGFALTGAPETGHQRRLGARAARAGHVPRPLAAPVPRRRRRHAAPVKRRSSSSSARASSLDDAASSRGARARDRASSSASGTPVCVVSSGAIALGLRSARTSSAGRAACRGCRPRPRSGSRCSSAAGRTRSRAHGVRAAQVLLTAAEIADRARVRQRAQHARRAVQRSASCRS